MISALFEASALQAARNEDDRPRAHCRTVRFFGEGSGVRALRLLALTQRKTRMPRLPPAEWASGNGRRRRPGPAPAAGCGQWRARKKNCGILPCDCPCSLRCNCPLLFALLLPLSELLLPLLLGAVIARPLRVCLRDF